LASVHLFVYGSLKRGGRHHEELRDARFLGEARTASGFDLVPVELSGGSYLALVTAPGKPSSVPGELFEVPVELLPALDDFEGDAYERKDVALSAPHDSAAAPRVVAYFRAHC
jgi:gamma-glutamylcyclotransferase (GGCT)/AIG2-like uncharacterized protein YtfP